MKYYFLASLAFLLLSFSEKTKAEEVNKQDSKITIRFDTRFDVEYTTYGKDSRTDSQPEDKGGFIGRYFKVLVDGKINDKFSYSFRHRLYVNPANPKEFFSATDWAHITYHPNSKFSLTAGKQMVCIGTYEYDYAPIDVHFASDFWNHVSPFQIGFNLGYKPSPNHSLQLQMTNSPFSSKGFQNMYAFGLIWYGRPTKWFNTIYSLNLMDYEKGNYINYIALGNRFSFGNIDIDIDYINRYAGKNTAFFADFSLIGNISYRIGKYFKVFAKAGYDQNKAQRTESAFIYDRYVLPGVERGFYGAGLEYFPLTTARNNIRLHAFWYSTNEDPIPQTFNIGIKWQIKALDR